MLKFNFLIQDFMVFIIVVDDDDDGNVTIVMS